MPEADPSPRWHPTVAAAWHLARAWYAGHTLDGLPALSLAAEVVAAVGRGWPDAPPGLVAAALLHDAPRLAPAGTGVYATIAARLGTPVADTVRAVDYEAREGPVPVDAAWALHVCAARKIVGYSSAVRAAALVDAPAPTRAQAILVLTAHLPALREFHARAAPHLRAGMAAELSRLVATAGRVQQAATRLGEHPGAGARAAARQAMADLVARLDTPGRGPRRGGPGRRR